MRGRSLFSAVPFLVLSLGVVATAAALEVGARAPDIEGRTLDGERFQLSRLRGKVVLVDFWASWCDPCREEMPVLERLHERYKDRGLVVVGVSVDRTERNARAFLRRTPVSFPIIHDGGHRIAGRYSPPKMPSSYIIDKRGVVRHIHEGFRSGDGERMEREIRALLAD